MKKILLLPVLVAMISIAFFSIQTVTAAGPLDLTGLDNFGILANTYTNSINPNTLTGDLGYTVPNATPLTTHNGVTYVGTDAIYINALVKQAALYTAGWAQDNLEACTTTTAGATVLDNVIPTGGSIPGTLIPGVYCINGAATIGTAGITLSGNGVYIFRINGTLGTTLNSQVTLLGANANDVFWLPIGGTTLASNTGFAGNIVTHAATTLGGTVTMNGRILSNDAVTTTGPNVVITTPTASSVPVPTIITSNDCTFDCFPPTIGVGSNNEDFVDQGFSYNGITSDVDTFSTSYPVLTTKVGVVNKAVFKIYEDGGPDEVRHLELAFGLAPGQIFGDSEVVVEWDKTWNGIETTKVKDPKNALKDVSVVTSEGPCKPNSIKNDCLIVTIYHTFEKPLAFNGVAVNVWDDSRNAWQNRLTNGVLILGDTTRPAAKHVVADSAGHVSVITELTSHIAVDKLGKYWSLDKNGFWVSAFVADKNPSVLSYWSGYDRNDLVSFAQMKKGQALIAKGSWDSSKIQTSPLHIIDRIQNFVDDRDTINFDNLKKSQNLLAKKKWDSSAIQNQGPGITDKTYTDKRDTLAFENLKKAQALKAKGYFDSSEIQNLGTPEKSVSPATMHCLDNGGKIKVQGTGKFMQSICVFPNGSQCEEGKYFRGECSPKKSQ
ncbi:ice-binding family protein [Candidatus Nitrosotenuis chungbukensis]|uniref:ice-binding family protein n=1 Tax=Candidatus Nitrosotenuis chungbukensis TaxID=1353246 RepID=UPI002671105A|nr:ice-binding family protein [Candidatus Nitrosotenuis chungbukensis]WKT57137.1 ice-binding family protein [Candidatus Nitrosotenuis chungbukensis]